MVRAGVLHAARRVDPAAAALVEHLRCLERRSALARGDRVPARHEDHLVRDEERRGRVIRARRVHRRAARPCRIEQRRICDRRGRRVAPRDHDLARGGVELRERAMRRRQRRRIHRAPDDTQEPVVTIAVRVDDRGSIDADPWSRLGIEELEHVLDEPESRDLRRVDAIPDLFVRRLRVEGEKILRPEFVDAMDDARPLCGGGRVKDEPLRRDRVDVTRAFERGGERHLVVARVLDRERAGRARGQRDRQEHFLVRREPRS